MSFVLGVVLFVFVIGRFDARLPWPKPARSAAAKEAVR